MLRASVAVVGVIISRAGREMDRSGYLLVEQRVAHGLFYVRVEPERELSYIPRSFVGVEYAVYPFSVVRLRVDYSAVFELKRDILKSKAAFYGRRVVGYASVYAASYRRGIYFTVGKIHMPGALFYVYPFNRERKIGINAFYMHFIRVLHTLLHGVHSPVHLCVVERADVEVEVLERLGAHIGKLRHRRVRETQHYPFLIRYADAEMHPLVIDRFVKIHLIMGYVDEL